MNDKRRKIYDTFKQRFESELQSAASNRQAFDRTADFFESILTFRPYTYESWCTVRSRKKSNKHNLNNVK